MRLKLYTLKYRRLRGDMIEVFKIIHHKYRCDNTVARTSLIHNSKAVTIEVTSSNCITKLLITILENTSSLHALLIYGILCLTVLLMCCLMIYLS